MRQTKWFDRKFEFNSAQNIFPSVIERLSGTSARLEEKMGHVKDEVAATKKEGAWSIKENIGHLIDLEPLWTGRLEDILNKKKELREADLTNQKTHLANHNAKSISELLNEFRQNRLNTIQKLKLLTEEEIFMSSLHPRLKTPMRVMDHFLFVADHDDHHLVTINEILNS